MAASALATRPVGWLHADGLSPPPHLGGCHFLLIYLLIPRHFAGFHHLVDKVLGKSPVAVFYVGSQHRGRSLCDFALRCKWDRAGLHQAEPRANTDCHFPPPQEMLFCWSSLMLTSLFTNDKCPFISISLLITQLDNLVPW